MSHLVSFHTRPLVNSTYPLREWDPHLLLVTDTVLSYLNLHSFSTPSSPCHFRCTHSPLSKGLSLEIATRILTSFKPRPLSLDIALPVEILQIVLSYLEGSFLPLMSLSTQLSTLENKRIWRPFVGNCVDLPLWKRGVTGDFLLAQAHSLNFASKQRLCKTTNTKVRLFDCRLICFGHAYLLDQKYERVYENNFATQTTSFTSYTLRNRRDPLYFSAFEVARTGVRFFSYDHTKGITVHCPIKNTYQRVNTPQVVDALHFNETTSTLWASISSRIFQMPFSKGVLGEPVPTSIVHARTIFISQWTTCLVVGSRENVTFWDSRTHKQLSSFRYRYQDDFNAEPFHMEPASATLFIATAQRVIVLDLQELREKRSFQHPDANSQISRIAITGNLLLTSHENKTIRLWDVSTRTVVGVFSTPYPVLAATVFHNSFYLLFKRAWGNAELWKWTHIP